MSAAQPMARRPARQAGFTLIELLIAAGITAFLAGTIAVIVTNVSTTWSRAGTRLGADAQARIVLDRLQLDLQGALYRDDGNVWFAADVLDRTGNSGLWDNTGANVARLKPAGAPLSLRLDRPGMADVRFGQAGVWLRFFTTRQGSNTALAGLSAPVAVGYQIIRRPTSVNAPAATVNRAYLLHRAEARPWAEGNREGVLESGYDITAPAYDGGGATNDGGQTGDPRGIRAPGTNTPPRNLDAVLADNVIDFGIRCYARDAAAPGGLRLIFPANDAGVPSNGASARLLRSTLPPGTPAAQWGGSQPFPDVVDVMVRVLTDKGAELIADLERARTPAPVVPAKYNNNAQQWWWGVAEENSRVYTRRITLNVKAP